MSRLSTRVSIKWADNEASEPTDTHVMTIGEYYMDLRVKKADTTIDWAMAGQRLIKSEDPMQCLFTHEIDSRGYTSPDLGIFSELPNGDFLEVGEMPWPEQDNKVTAYEEIWHEYPAPPVGSVSWIVKNESKENGITFLGRLEGSFLAFRKNEKEGFTAVREERDGKGGWKVVYRIGKGEVPRAEEVVGCDLKGMEERKEIEILGVEYLVCAVAVEGKE